MSTMGADYNQLSLGSTNWLALAELMTSTSRDLAGQGTGALAPGVQSAAQAFLTAWSGYAAESSTLATGFADALDARVTDYSTTDQGAESGLTDLDGRLGPAR
ncbi:hypothetical protein [Nocardioides marmotae]|uniref:ESX-1 secretion-associated protein n=1 Tax=Nocardioides marmotae TaxID=2663857 RepID=A0A6I3JF27_9ACTN|nr:hypothetical protein [Nocardioides marmotae]MCR6033023.1 hypothetical protein [Gordonia jinghuaiqii]MBC9732522.1 hypothetical protein [Nocardioides marmotae]MTB83641.1 hypothetical protein [Nocardioides marmotae]MTB96675.1 hypothetical protein [Nocardioides marmotae]QKE03110.1 hypothetical protein HPC71_20125 [Nocardioides marmotae]